MTRIAWNFTSRGAQYRPPTFRVYVSPVVSGPDTCGEPAEWLRERHVACWTPVKMRWGVNGQPSTLALRRALGVGPDKPARDRPEDGFCMPGDRVRLVEVHGGGPRGTVEREWFRGYAGQDRILVEASPDTEAYEVVAYGPEIRVQAKAVSGRWHAKPDADEQLVAGTFADGDLSRENVFRSHLPIVFNEDGQPNASPAEVGGKAACWHLDTDGGTAAAGRTFEAPSRQIANAYGSYKAAWWRARSAVQSLIEIVDDYHVISPESMALLPAELAERTLGEVDVEALNLLEALRAVLLPVGFGFCVEPWAREDGRHVLHVFELHGGTEGARVRKPYMAPIHGPAKAATDEEGQRAEVQRIEFVRDNHNVANDVTVIGDQKRKQVCLVFSAGGSQLSPAWDTSTYNLEQWATDGVIDPTQWPADAGGLLTVQHFDEHFTHGARGSGDCRHVFRSFVWNEDGSFQPLTGGFGDAAGCGTGESGEYARRPRPVGTTFLRDDAEAPVRNSPPFVRLGVEGDDSSWIQVPAVTWKDRAGFTLPVNPLWGWYPYATQWARHARGDGGTLFDLYGECSYLTLLYNALRNSGVKLSLRLVGSVECDEAVTARAPRRAASSWPFVAQRIVRAENRFVWRDVPDGSDPLDLPADRHDTRDDSADAADYARRVRSVLADEVGHGSILLRHLTRSYTPGDVIPRTQGRTIDLTVRGGDGRHAPVVAGVVWSFRPGTCKTELLLDTALLRATQ